MRTGVVMMYVIVGVSDLAIFGIIALSMGWFSLFGLRIGYINVNAPYVALVPTGEMVSINGQPYPVVDVVYYDLNGGLHDLGQLVLGGMDGQYLLQQYNEMQWLNAQNAGQINPYNGQPFVPLSLFYLIGAGDMGKQGVVTLPIENVTINGQQYPVIDSNLVNQGYVAGLYTYEPWINNIVKALDMNQATPENLLAGLPIFNWKNVTGTVAGEILAYQLQVINFNGGYILVLSNGTVIPYGATAQPRGLTNLKVSGNSYLG